MDALPISSAAKVGGHSQSQLCTRPLYLTEVVLYDMLREVCLGTHW